MPEKMHYAGRVVVITGASSGFGRGTALELARRGAHVVLAARSGEALRSLALECSHGIGRGLAVETDVSDPAAVERLFERTLAEFGHCDVWINNAGVAAIGRFDEVPLVDHEQVLRTDLLGTLYGSYSALKHFRARGEGILINVASVIGKIPAPYYASYAAAKFGIVGFCDALRQELILEKIDRIRVCTVLPMAHATEFFEHAGNYTGRTSEPIPPTYDPQITIDALVKLVVEPEDEIMTGRQGPMFNILHHLMPNAVEKMMANRTEKVQFEQSQPAVDHAGNIHKPSQE